MKENEIHIHTDGSCLGNPGPGGWAAIIHFNKKEIILKGGEKDTTNNRMEMTAIVGALEYLHEQAYEAEQGQENAKLTQQNLQNSQITIFSDSRLIIQTLTQGWKRKANIDLWAELDRLRAWLNIEWTWVKGHANNKYNNQADEIAVKEAEKQKNG